MPRALLMTLAVAMPFSHYATTPLFQFYTESFVWGCVPWVLLGALALARVWQQRPDARLLLRCALLGLAAGLLYWLKYSAVFVSGGVLLFVAWLTLRKWHNRSGFRIGPLLAVGVPLVATLVALIAWNKHMGASANSFTSTRGWYVDWHNLVDAVASFPLAMTDAEGLLGWLLFKPGRRLIENPGLLRLAALPCGCALFWLVWRRRHEEPSTWLARCVATASALGVFIVWTFSGAGDHAARHVAGAAVMLVPVAIQEFSYLRRGWLRQVVLVVGAVVIAVPLLYGAASVAGKAFRARGYRAAASGFYNPQLSRTDAAAVIRRLHAYASPQAVWYVCDGATAIDLPGRSLIRWADFLPIDTLARETHRSSVPMRINLLLPPHFEQNGKGAVIRASFPQAQAWAAINIAGAEYTLWSAKLN